MPETDLSQRPETERPQDWCQALIHRYHEEGFVPWMIIPSAPPRPVERSGGLVGGRYDFEQTELPYDSPDDALLAETYHHTISAMKRYFGNDHVQVAHPTTAMVEANPTYGERPHRLIMVRGSGLL